MIAKKGFYYGKSTKFAYVYKKDGSFFTHYKLCKWYCVLKWRQEIGYIHEVKNIFLEERFPFFHNEIKYEFLPQFKIWYRENETPEFQVYTKYSEWYRKTYQKSFQPNYSYMNIRFLDEVEIKKITDYMKTTLNYKELIEVKEMKDVIGEIE